MATLPVAAFDGGAVRVELDYDEATGAPLALRCVNVSAESTLVELWGRRYAFAGRVTGVVELTGAEAGRRRLERDRRGRLLGLDVICHRRQ
jgi:hypothetical protein